MRRRVLFSLVALGLVVRLASPAQAVLTESKVTGDDTLAATCSPTRRTEATNDGAVQRGAPPAERADRRRRPDAVVRRRREPVLRVHLLQPLEADQRRGVRGEVHRSRGDVRADRAREAREPLGPVRGGAVPGQDQPDRGPDRCEFAGNVYTACSQYHGLQSGNNAVLFARSTHHGLSYSRPGNDADGVNSGDVVQARVAQSSDGGETWSEQVVSTAGSKLRVDDPWVPARRVLG